MNPVTFRTYLLARKWWRRPMLPESRVTCAALLIGYCA